MAVLFRGGIPAGLAAPGPGAAAASYRYRVGQLIVRHMCADGL